jgi:hypothetical protein
MSKNTAPQTVTVTTEQSKKAEKKKLFGLSAQDLQMVVGGGGVIVHALDPSKK